MQIPDVAGTYGSHGLISPVVEILTAHRPVLCLRCWRRNQQYARSEAADGLQCPFHHALPEMQYFAEATLCRQGANTQIRLWKRTVVILWFTCGIPSLSLLAPANRSAN